MDEINQEKLSDQVKLDKLIESDRKRAFIKEKLCYKIWIASVAAFIGLNVGLAVSPTSTTSFTREVEQLTSIGSVSSTYQDGIKTESEMQVDKYIMHDNQLKDPDTLEPVEEKNLIIMYSAWEEVNNQYQREKIVYEVNVPNEESEREELINATITKNLKVIANNLVELPEERRIETTDILPQNLEPDIEVILNDTHIIDDTPITVNAISENDVINRVVIQTLAMVVFGVISYYGLYKLEELLKQKYSEWSNINNIYKEKNEFEKKHNEGYTYVKNRLKKLKD